MIKQKRSTIIKNGVPPTKERRRQNGGVYAEVIHKDAKGHSHTAR